MKTKSKKLITRLDEKTHLDYMIWCRTHGSNMQTVTLNLIKGIMRATPDQDVSAFLVKSE